MRADLTSFDILDAARGAGVRLGLHKAQQWAQWLNVKPEAERCNELDAWLLDEAQAQVMAHDPDAIL